MRKFKVVEKSRFLDENDLSRLKGGDFPTCNPYFCNEAVYNIHPPCSMDKYSAACGDSIAYHTCSINIYSPDPCYHLAPPPYVGD